MCGIAGYSGNFESTLLKRMGGSIRARGPDNIGFWKDNEKQIGLVHTRLSIIDLSELSNQPMISQCGNIVITFNGEIYNFQELRKSLEENGYTFKTKGDTEVLIYLYHLHGLDFLKKLNGIFALSLFDKRINKMFIARDGQGIKPLYFSQTDKGILFASELKAILQEPSVSRELDHDAISSYITYLWCPSPRTMLKNVKKLEQGNCITIANGKIENQWEFYDYPVKLPSSNLSKKDAIRKTALEVENAVKRQLISDVSIGAFLSGGLDSSSVVAMAKKVEPDIDLPCYTIDFRGDDLKSEGMVEDLPYAEKIADHLNLQLNKVEVTSDMILDIEKMIYHLDEPQADPAPLNAMYISELAKSQGIKVLLSGAGGDDIFTGYRRHYALQKEKYWNWMPIFAKKALKSSLNRFESKNTYLRRLSKAFKYADLDKQQRLVSYFYWIDPTTSSGLFSDKFKSKFTPYSPEKQLMLSLEKLPDGVSDLTKMLYLEQKHFLTDHNLNYTDKVSMAHGVEVRVPLLDPYLIEHAQSLPDSYKQNGSIGKWVFKKAMEPYLPKDVIYRPKTGFGAPLRYWMRNDLRPLVDDILSESSLAKRGIFNPDKIKDLILKDSAGMGDYSYPLFAIISIELWCRIFIDNS